MAYKFQSGDAILSGGLLQEGDVEVESGFSFKMHESTILDTSRNLANVGTISGSGAIQGASVSVDGVVTAGGFTIGSAVINEAELEMIDGITAGTAAASKALVLDASSVLDGSSSMIVSASAISASSGQFTNLTVAANSLTIGSTVISETEMAVIDGVTPGTVAASKAVIVDSNKDADGFRNVSGSGLFEADWFQATRNVTAGAGGSGGAFILGNANMSEADLEKLDDITNGTVAASKAVVVDSNKDASGFRNVTATGAFIIGSANMDETDLEKLDGITNGTAAASKAVVLDANKDVSGLRDISGRNATLSGLTEGNVTFAGSSGLLQDDDAMGYNDDGMGGGKFFQVRSKGPSGNNFTSIMAKTGSISVLNAAEDGLLAYLGYDGTISGSNELHITGHAKFQDNIYASGTLALAGNADLNGQLDVASNTTLGGTLTAASLGSATVDLTADLMVIDDGAAGAIKTTSLANYATALAGGSNEGLKSTAGRLGLDHNDLAAADISVANDSFAFVDADDSNKTKKESVADLMTAVAGNGLAASSGVLALDVNELSQAAVADGDFIVIEDATDNSTKKEAVADLASLFAGTGLKAASSVMALDVQELSQAAVASGDFFVIEDATDNSTKKESVDDLASLFAGTGLKAASAVLSLDVQELSEAAVASGDFFVIEDATDNSTKKESVDDLATLFAGNGLAAASAVLSVDLNELSAASVDVANDSIAIIDANDSNGSKKESIVDLVAAMAGAGLTAASGQLKVTGNDVVLKADGDTLAEGYNYFADISSDAAVTLPASPSVGDVVHVKAGAISGANVEITISRAGSQVIDNDLTAIYLESSFAAVSLVYVANNEWRIV